jgi:hypothetical protein
MKLRAATRDDVLAWFGSVPATMRAIVAEHEGSVVGIAGVSTMADHVQAWSAFDEVVRGHPVLMARAAVLVRRMIESVSGPVTAVCSETEPTAPALLARLGFEQVEGRRWVHG